MGDVHFIKTADCDKLQALVWQSLCRVPRDEIPNTRNQKADLVKVVFLIFSMCGLVPQIQPRGDALLVEFVIDLRHGQVRIHLVGFLRLHTGRSRDCGINSMFLTELAKMDLKRTASDDSRSVFVSLVEQVLGHLQEVSKD